MAPKDEVQFYSSLYLLFCECLRMTIDGQQKASGMQVTISSDDENSDDGESGESPEDDSQKKWSTRTNLVYPASGGYIGLKEQTPAIREIVQAGIVAFLATVIFETAFPSPENLALGLRKTLCKCAKKLDHSAIADRLKADAKYGKDMGQLVSPHPSFNHFCSHVA
jgi:hypothetical protein